MSAVVYQVKWEDLERYQSLHYDLPEVPRELRVFDGAPKEATWKAPPVYSDLPRLERPEFWHLWGVAAIVMVTAVTEELSGFLHPVGELLPLRMSGTNETLLALNILRDVDCLDPARYRLDDLEIWTDFIEHRLPEGGLFKVPQVDNVEMFYLEYDDDDEALRDSIDRNDYHGITFRPVWSSDGRIEPVNLLSVS